MSEIKKNEDYPLREFVTMMIGEQVFGISVTYVMDVLLPQEINATPLARREVLGSLNLRGRVVTAIDIRHSLNIKESVNLKKSIYVVIEYKSELYSLIVDEVHDVINIPVEKVQENPENLNKFWQKISLGIYPVENELVVILDINKVMDDLMIITK